MWNFFFDFFFRKKMQMGMNKKNIWKVNLDGTLLRVMCDPGGKK